MKGYKMRSFRELKHNYRFTEEDEKRLAGMRPLMEEYADEVMSTLGLWIMGTKGAAKFFTEESRKKHVFDVQRQWFTSLFTGEYGNKFYEMLMGIGRAHVKYNVDAHYMNRAINIVKNACIGIISKSEEDRVEATNKIISVGKILDICLDVITTSYIEEELRTYSPAYKVKSLLVTFAERFSHSANIILVFSLMGLTMGVLWLFLNDVNRLLQGDIERGIISSLGSLLILWVMIELINTEISHLKGGKFHISVFIGVALVTTIRELMIATLKHEKPEFIYYLIASIFVIGIVYWLVVKTEEKNR